MLDEEHIRAMPAGSRCHSALMATHHYTFQQLCWTLFLLRTMHGSRCPSHPDSPQELCWTAVTLGLAMPYSITYDYLATTLGSEGSRCFVLLYTWKLEMPRLVTHTLTANCNGKARDALLYGSLKPRLCPLKALYLARFPQNQEGVVGPDC